MGSVPVKAATVSPVASTAPPSTSVPDANSSPLSLKKGRKVDDMVNIRVLFSVLDKLTCSFELNESLAGSLVKCILDAPHRSPADSYLGTKSWLNKNCEVSVTPREIMELIKYVRLHEVHNRLKDANDDIIDVEKGDKVNEGMVSYLVCPFHCDVVAWEVAIRKKEEEFFNSNIDFSFADKDCTLDISSRHSESEHYVCDFNYSISQDLSPI
jgi:hypothetical protein